MAQLPSQFEVYKMVKIGLRSIAHISIQSLNYEVFYLCPLPWNLSTHETFRISSLALINCDIVDIRIQIKNRGR